MLSQDVQAYLAVRRAMGFGMKWSGNLLRGFAAFSDAAGQHHVCSETAIKWAGSTPSVRTRARRLGLVIRLARYLRAEDQRHEVPPPVFGSEDRPRRNPYIYSREDVQRLVQAASGVGRYPNPEYRGLTYTTFFGLLACTGMRLSEAINLQMQDITADGLVIRHTKFRKSRLLPLHSTTQAALERYLPKRRVFAPFDDHVFVGLRKHKLFRHDAYVAFRRTIETIGLPRHPGLPRPTIHALRHTFAVRALETCPDERDRITRHMVALGVAILTQPTAPGFHPDGVVVKLLSDTSLCFKTCVILRADNTSRLVEEYVRMFLRKYAPQRLPPKQVKLSPPVRVLGWKKPIPPSRS